MSEQSTDNALTTQKRVIGRPFAKGNPGRPLGAKDKLARNFHKVLNQDFKQHGVSAVTEAREKDPVGYLRVVASVIKEGSGGPANGAVVNILIAADERDV